MFLRNNGSFSPDCAAYIPENETHCDFEVGGWPHENRI
jgi:hypothetical protein